MKTKDPVSGKFVKGKKFNRTCKQCGKVELVVPSLKDRPFCSYICKSESQKGKLIGNKHPNWKGGRIYDRGYVVITAMHDHPMADSRGQVREHRLIMSQHIGRTLEKWEDVHHINGIKDDNRIENLELLSHREHISKDSAQRGKKYWGINSHLNTP